MIKCFDKLLLAFNRMLIAVMMGGMFVLVATNVVGRYFFDHSLAWAEEVSSFLMIWVTFLGAGLALREGRHVAIDFLQEAFSVQNRKIFRFVLGVLILSFLVALIYFGIEFVIFGWNKETSVTEIPRGIPYLAVPIGCALFALHLLISFRAFLTRDWDQIQSDDIEGEA